jgi:hypothetical protein
MVNLLHDAQRTVNDAIQPLIKECSVHSVVIADMVGIARTSEISVRILHLIFGILTENVSKFCSISVTTTGPCAPVELTPL